MGQKAAVGRKRYPPSAHEWAQPAKQLVYMLLTTNQKLQE